MTTKPPIASVIQIRVSPTLLRVARENAGISKTNMMRYIGATTASQVTHFESGMVAMNMNYLTRWLQACGCTIADVTERTQ